MASTSKLRLAAAVLVALGLPAALVAACSSNNSHPTPNTPVVYSVTDGGDDSTTQTGADGSTTATDGSTGASPYGGATDASNDARAPACSSVLTDAGCWICPSQTPTSSEFLNQCSGVG